MDVSKLKTKILDLAIRGKLVTQDVNDEPANFLVERIRSEKAKLIKEGKIKKPKLESLIYRGEDGNFYEKTPSGIRNIDEEIPFPIPDNWTFARMNSVLDVRDGTHDSPKYYKEGIPFVTSKNLKNDGIDFSSCKLISVSDSIKFNERSRVDDKDILFAMIGTIGNPTIVNKDREFSIKNVALFKNVCRDCLSEFWVKYVLESLTEKMKYDASGGLQPFVSLDFLRNFIMPIPPINEQHRIILYINNLNQIVNEIKHQIDSLQEYVSNAKKRILELVFGDESIFKDYLPNEFALGNVLEYEQPGPYIVSSTEYDNSYKTPVLTPGKSFILGYTNESFGIYHPKSKVIIFDDFTTASRLIDFDFKVKSSAMKILSSSDDSKFNIDYMYNLLQTIHINSDTHKRFWISEYAPINLKIHKPSEQKTIVEFINKTFKMLDELM